MAATTDLVGITSSSIDGVRSFALTEQHDEYLGALMFRVGFVDEPLYARGVTHLVEHLALSDPLLHHDDPDLQWNGHVQAHTTTFYAEGDPVRVAAFLRSVSDRLHHLPKDRIVAERRVLRAEAARRGASLVGHHLGLRFGTTGIGTVDEQEWALRWIERRELTQWTAHHFTAANAVAAFTGSPPPGLRFDLPPGAPLAVPRAVALPERFPALANGPRNRVSVSFLGPRGIEFPLAIAVVADVVRTRLRERDARTYHVDTVIEHVDGEQALGMVVADCLDEDASVVREAISVELARLRLDGPEDACLRRVTARPSVSLQRQERERVRRARESVIGAAIARLTDRPFVSEDERSERLAAITPSVIRRCIADMLGTALWTVPPGAPVNDHRLHPVREWSDARLTGITYRRGAGASTEAADEQLVVGSEGITLVVDEDRQVTLPYQELTLAVRYPDRVWLLVGREGFRLELRARDWYGGNVVVDELDRLVPHEIRVAMTDEADADTPDVDPPAPAPARWMAGPGVPPAIGPNGFAVPPPPPAPPGGPPVPPAVAQVSRSPVPVRILAAAAVWLLVAGIIAGIVTTTGRMPGRLVVVILSAAVAATSYVWRATN